MTRSRDGRRKQPSGDRQQDNDRRERATLTQRAEQPAIADGEVHADRQHQHREADFCQQRDGGPRRMDCVEHLRTDQDAREQLADDHRHEEAAAEHREHGPAEPGQDDHDERSKTDGHVTARSARSPARGHGRDRRHAPILADHRPAREQSGRRERDRPSVWRSVFFHRSPGSFPAGQSIYSAIA